MDAEMNIWEVRKPEISRLYADGYSQADLAAYYRVSQPAMVKIMRRIGIATRPAKPRLETERREIAPTFVELTRGVFAKPGWWNPGRPSVFGVKRSVRVLDAVQQLEQG